jgi:DNA polymerase I-like protein with 3'-5' exonuclease and polymerase domains
LEHSVAPICDEITASGIPFDKVAGERQQLQWEARRNDLEKELHAQFPEVKNWNSRLQMGTCLVAQGWEPEEFTEKTKQPKLTDEVFEDELPKLFPQLAGIAEYQVLVRRLGQLANGKQSWLNQLEADGRIHGGIKHIGTPHSRAAHLGPNIGQVPNPKKGKPFARECRELFRLNNGWVFVTCDQSGLQDRAFAHYLAAFDNGAYAKAYVNGLDPHWAATLALGLVPPNTPRDKTNKLHEVLREGCKSWRYGFLFGMGGGKGGAIIRNTIKAAMQIDPHCTLMCKFFGSDTPSAAVLKRVGSKAIDRFVAVTPGLRELRRSLEAQVRQHGWISGLDGRRVPVLHVALNYSVTSAEAILCKPWLVQVRSALGQRFVYGWDGDVVLVAWVHDELVACCRPEIADEIGAIMVHWAKETGEHYEF